MTIKCEHLTFDAQPKRANNGHANLKNANLRTQRSDKNMRTYALPPLLCIN